MPSTRPCAAFEPISPDFDLAALVEATPGFEYVTRIHCEMIDQQGIQAFEKLVLLHVVLGGKPLVVEGYNERLEPWTFATQWLKDNCASKVERARDITKKSDLPLTIGHYLNSMNLLADQWNARNYKEPDRQRIYLKDIDCPQVWHDKLKEIIPPGLYYLNDSTGDLDGPGAITEPEPNGHGMKRGKGIAKAGDLMSCLPAEMRAENMMCYIGHEGTYTPAHREMCASLGQNIMVETSTGAVENGKPTRPGSSIWFMTETKDRQVVSEYWLSTLGHDIEIENHYAQINAWKAAPFKTYIVEQKVGDLILIPPLAPHQVWNRGTRTMKAAWNRTTVETLEMALSEALPRARMVCRDEQYKNKAMIYYALVKYSNLLRFVDVQKKKMGRGTYPIEKQPKVRQLHKDFRRLFALYTRVLLSESFTTDHPEGKKMQFLPFESIVTCAYCRCNIFNRFLTCPSCVTDLPNGDEDTYDICMECYAMGRSCACMSKLKWVEQFEWDDLVQKHDAWRHQIIAFEGQVNDKSPRALYIERENLGKKTLAQICQVELKRRPWNDITKPPTKDLVDEEEAVEVDDDGKPKKKRKIRRSEKWHKEHGNCHIHRGPEPVWKLATCTQCSNSYCYGTLFRAFDLMPQTVMEDLSWKCPKCLMICSCSTCRKDPAMQPFEPRGTLLGHDTSKVADPRSVESLVNFSVSNVSWLKKAGDDHPHDTRRIRRRLDEAETAKSKDLLLGDDYVDHDAPVEARLAAAMRKEFPLDPMLGSDYGSSAQLAQDSLNSISSSFEESQDGPQFVNPDQLMYHHDFYEQMEHGVAEGITYVYPDPENPQYVHRQSPEPGPEPAKQNEEAIVIVQQGGKKRKKQHSLVQSDSVDPGLGSFNPENQRKQPPATKKATNGARDETWVTRRSKVLTLAIDKSKLADMSSTLSQDPASTTAVPGSIEPVEIIQSDLQPVHETPQAVLPQTLRTIVRLERDDEFKPRKDRKSRAKNPPIAAARTSATYLDALELSDDEGAIDSHASHYSTIRTRSKGDSTWLRLRKDSEDATSPDTSQTLVGDGTSERRLSDTVRDAQNSESQSISVFPTRGTTDERQTQGTNGRSQTEKARPSLPSGKKNAVAPPPTPTMSAEQIAENRRAKMEAVRWAEGMDGDSDSRTGDASSASIPPATAGSRDPSYPSKLSSQGPPRPAQRNGSHPPVASISRRLPIKNAIRPSRGRGGASMSRRGSRAACHRGRLS